MVMSVGRSVGSWRIALGALRSFVTVLAARMTLAAERRSGAKLHWRVTISPLLPNGNRHSNSSLSTTFVMQICSGKGGSDLLG